MFFLDPEETTESDPISPAHYKTGSYECINVMQEVFGAESVRAFCLLNAFKYLYRCKKKKDTPLEDVKKSLWYLKKYVDISGDE